MTLNMEKLIEDLSSLSILEAVELVKKLETQWGVSAHVSSGSGSGEMLKELTKEPVAEKTEFDVELTTVGEKKLQVIKIIREITGLGLKEAKDLVDGAPNMVKKGISKAEAESIKSKLETEGAKVLLK
ncbi:MAG: 50S ribosomal protein L7/L12 [Deltaproteobacteria bacterium]|nr:MAG: 50S ribosomal protein L7/L12 [Deltaproteobacteria bacterium]